MVSVEKEIPNNTYIYNSRHTIRFTVYPHKDSTHNGRLFIELSPHASDASVIRLSNSTGETLMLHGNPRSGETYIVRNLQAGTYFFEINDGFFYQVKELRIPA